MREWKKGDTVYAAFGRANKLFRGEVVNIMGIYALLKMKCPEWNIANPGMICTQFVLLKDLKEEGEQLKWQTIHDFR